MIDESLEQRRDRYQQIFQAELRNDDIADFNLQLRAFARESQAFALVFMRGRLKGWSSRYWETGNSLPESGPRFYTRASSRGKIREPFTPRLRSCIKPLFRGGRG